MEPGQCPATYSPLVDVEPDFVTAFVAKPHRERWTSGLADPRLRVKLLERLWHRDDWDERFAMRLHCSGKRPEWLRQVVQELKDRGAPDTAYVLAVDADLDGTVMPLVEAVDRFSDNGGAVVICVPSKLAIHFQEIGLPLLLTR